MKKRKIFIAFISAVVLLFGCTACGPHNDDPDVVFIGETCEIYEDGITKCIVTYNSCSFETLKENEEILVIENITIRPTGTLTVTSDDVLLGVGYELHDSDELRHRTSDEENIRINGYNIFDDEISEEVEYSFCFIIPYEKDGTAYFDIGFDFLIFQSYYLQYHF